MNKKIKLLIPTCIIISILYITLAAKPLPTEISFLPMWTIDATHVSKNQTEQSDTEQLIPFRLGQTLGYFTSNGTVKSLVSFPYKAALSDNSYALYGTSTTGITIYSNTGEKIGTIKSEGFPFFINQSKYIFLPGGAAFSTLKDNGEEYWTYEGISPIISFSDSEFGCAAGFADGSIITFTKDGKIDQTIIPGGSEYPVILGCAISQSGNYVAAVSGSNSQRFILSKKTNGFTSIILHKYLPKEVNRQLLIKFSNDEKRVYFDNGEGLGIVDCETLVSKNIPIKGDIISIKESTQSKVIYVLSKIRSQYTVSVIESFDTISGSFTYKAQSSFITTEGSSLFIGRDSKISKIDVTHK